MSNKYVKLMGCGSYLPGKPVPFDDVDKVLGCFTKAPPQIIKWLENIKPVMKEILEVKYYHYAIDPETREFTEDNLSLCVKAAGKALADCGMEPGDIDFIIYGGPYLYQMPCLSVQIQDALGIENCAEMSIQANCTSAYKALMTAYHLIRDGGCRTPLVLSSNMPSAQLRVEHYHQEIVRKEDLFLRWFLCDGAGALILQESNERSKGFYIENVYLESPGRRKPSAMYTNWPGYYLNPQEVYEKGLHHLKQMFQKQLTEHFHEEGGTIFFKGLMRMIEKCNIDLGRLKYLQINMPSRHVVDLIIDECKVLGIEKEQIYSSLSEYGYTGPPAAFISIDQFVKEKKLNHGDLLISFVTEVSKFMQAGFSLSYFE
ncbi:MAG: 3-oxoacyl-ACP synthase III family protein [Spirochaetales bacterium]|nr:3-oxoacyl-ACP synthase III family protein [Spirochaetales bacterium]